MLVAQISDLHIKPRGRLAYGHADTAAALKRCVAEIGRLPQKPDLVLMSGDLTDEGTVEEYAHLLDLLAPLKQTILAIPGNHDEREAMRAAFARRGFLPENGYLHFAYDDPAFPIRIIGLDTIVPGRSGGLLCQERLSWLEARLAEQPERPTLIAMHHPPFSTGIAHMDAIGLEGKEGFAEIVRQHPSVELVTCGHVHRLVRASVGGRPTLICPGPAHIVHLDLDEAAPATFRMEPPGFLLHWWNAHTLITHLVPVGDFDGPYPFFDETGQLLA
ncbi:phosphodiesterase [Chelativorans salis]|uniref:Phosphodiesterase n=1 Tax=Chelativorans salis TaxID=2978478 RepID=A0ABT2LKB3_9HYPH|nr:phosphodiesterase [Chelativorans sp. EGI FJ00035]MCT7374113.1 phosphodiesterase [Chelativorans sp. EGI FJ00035]